MRRRFWTSIHEVRHFIQYLYIFFISNQSIEKQTTEFFIDFFSRSSHASCSCGESAGIPLPWIARRRTYDLRSGANGRRTDGRCRSCRATASGTTWNLDMVFACVIAFEGLRENMTVGRKTLR